jgi:D-psicose/D-tagatose/L-ribulose 3-epimerase
VRNKVGIYYAYWAQDWDVDFVPYLSLARALGFDVLEVNAGTVAALSRPERVRLRESAAEAGLLMSCCIGLPPPSDIADEHQEIRRQGIAHLHRIGDAMADCAIQRLGGIIYSCWPGTPQGRGATKKQAWGWSVQSMKEAVRKAEDLGLLWNIEVVNRFEQFLINTAEEAVAYVEEVGSPNLKILLDTYHMNIEEDSFAAAIRTAGSLLGHMHLGETNRKPPGRGKVPWLEVAAALREVDYDGWIVMEPFLRPGGEVGRDIRVFRDLMPTADINEEARRACAFVKRFLA